MSQQSRGSGLSQPTGTGSARLVFSWALVSVPLAYGLYETVVKVANLFTG